jgi:hypothetical protein
MNDPVTGGRDALHHWSGYPWYDSAADGVRRIEVSPPRRWNVEGNWDFSLNFLGATLQFLAWTAIALALVGLAYLLIRAFWNREKTSDATKDEPIGAADRTDALPFPPFEAGRLDFLAEAERCRRQGDFGRAIIFLFSYQLRQLDQHGRIHLTRGKTNRQYLREILAAPLRGLVEQTMFLFEDAFFGHRPPGASAFDACWSRLEEFETIVAAG